MYKLVLTEPDANRIVLVLKTDLTYEQAAKGASQLIKSGRYSLDGPLTPDVISQENGRAMTWRVR